MSWMRVLLVLGWTALLIAGCGGGGSEVCSPDNPNGDCPPGQHCEGGQCVSDAPACSPESPQGVCPDGQTCLDGECVADSELCSALQPEGRCPAGRTCLDGVCRDDDQLCSGENPTGLCSAGSECVDGTCVAQAELCSRQNPEGRCPAGETCIDGSCVDNELICSPLNPDGLCPEGMTCVDGTCTDTAHPCSPDYPHGSCPGGQTCIDGSCVNNELLCSPGNPAGLCPSGEVCQGGMCVDASSVCSQQNPHGSCEAGETCLDGTCVDDDLLCSAENHTGLCPDGETCLDGSCVDDALLCGLANPEGLCPAGETCLEGRCVDDELLCSPENPHGLCPGELVCVDGACREETEPCSPAHPNGVCPTGETCLDGTCVLDSELCSPTNPTGRCPAGDQCLDGVCTPAGDVCSPTNPTGLCSTGESCLDGQCVDEDLLCSPTNPAGYCPAGQTCQDGTCQPGASACSPTNPTGVCPLGQLCIDGACEPLDESVLCDDDNDCTLDLFDFVRNRCVHQAQAAACSDGNACTDDVCVDGSCVSTPITGCAEPPEIDPVVSPTNVGTLNLSGRKAVNAAIWINGQQAVPSDDQTSWLVVIDLDPGENVFEIWSHLGVDSESVTVTVIYDITPPRTFITPGGGRFDTPLTVTVASDEPAVVYFSENGSEPTAHSEAFFSVRTFRVFDDTRLAFHAVDLAGNEEVGIVQAAFEVTDYANGWVAGPDLSESLIHPATAVCDGIIYVIGGSDGNAPVDAVWAFDPLAGNWESRAALPSPRSQAAAVDRGGLIYVLGGENNGTPLNTVSVYDPGANTWSDAATMPSTRYGLTAVLSGDLIYALGGKTTNGIVLDNLEIFDPSQDIWDNTAQAMPRPRAGLGAVAHDGRIFLFGGEDGGGMPIAEVDIYTISADAWTPGSPMPVPRAYAAVSLRTDLGPYDSGHRGALVAGGRVLGGAATDRASEYIFGEDIWKVRRPMPAAVHSGGSTSLAVPDDDCGQLWQSWIFGGQAGAGPIAVSLGYAHAEEPWHRLAPMPAERFAGAAAELNGLIYITGGRHHSDETSCWAFDPETETYAQCADLPASQKGAAAVSLDGRVWVLGGHNNFGQAVATVQAYDPQADRWEEMPSMLTGRRDLAAVILDGKIYAIGGDNAGPVQTVEVFDPQSGGWSPTTVMPERRSGMAAVGAGGFIYVFGGVATGGAYLDSVLRFDPVLETWTQLGANLPAPFAYGGAYLHGDDGVLLVGGLEGAAALRSGLLTYGLSGQTSAIILEPESTDMRDGLYGFALVPHHGKAYVFGGTTAGTEGVAAVQKLHPGRLPGCGVIESFEGGTFGSLDWSGSWQVSSAQAHTGSYSIYPGSVGHSGASTVYLDVTTTQGEICFQLRGSSESGYDYLDFYIDSSRYLHLSGDHDDAWTEYCFPLGASHHSLRWTYSRDGSGTAGWNAYYVDDVFVQSECY
ncbi:MAG: chitobiase/beta-hexosaminidase C-terminal domain-containing protein [Deltaproteobacteria bacterium]|nr:chitobiase/beta-hexosaminidase C-terminal domain-containing protein [Deltaproteobacteria bacterium]